jgi:signal transduction histidine kinase
MPAMETFQPTFTQEERRKVLAEQGGGHPLEMFKCFRRWKQSLARDLVYTFIWNLGFALVFTVFGVIGNWRLPSAGALWVNFLVANCCGYSLHLLFEIGGRTVERRVRRAGRVATTAYFMALSTFGVFIGFWFATLLLGRDFLPRLVDPRWLVSIALTSVVVSVVIAIIFFWREKNAQAEAALEREQRRAAESERLALAANLRALQAQIEPHFLFNTLANVTSLIDADPARARHMLESFIRFLRASLAATRRESTTLADEFALIRDFLDVLQVRMADRLQVTLELPPELAARAIPPMLLQPLVENAIRHGLEPRVEGGRLDLRASRSGDRLVLEVADTGAGFAGATSDGLGLANVRERLRLAHGDRARLSVLENRPAGTLVRLELPLEAA